MAGRIRRQAATIDIEAPPETVWALVADTEAHSSFDPTSGRIAGGPPEENARLRIHSALRSDKGVRVRVIAFSPPRRMAWRERSAFGLLWGVRSFAVDPLGRGSTRFTISEEFGGPLLPWVERSLPDMTPAFEGFCRGLKELAEAHAPPRRR
jgi:hypothetical protein